MAKEKERLETEIEIAREVQDQLYPKAAARLRRRCACWVCASPARMVSGDYYDYQSGRIDQTRHRHRRRGGQGNFGGAADGHHSSGAAHGAAGVAGIAGGASVHERLAVLDRAHGLGAESATATPPRRRKNTRPSFSPSTIEQPACLRTPTPATCSPCCFATAAPRRLDVNGTVVGAFPFSKYEESKRGARSGDLLVCYTDGITEPENEYGEMFGEERLIELVAKNAERRRCADHPERNGSACGNGPACPNCPTT